MTNMKNNALAKCIKIEIRTGHFRMNSHENTNNEHFEIFVEQIANKNLSFEKNKNGEKTKTSLFEIKKKKIHIHTSQSFKRN